MKLPASRLSRTLKGTPMSTHTIPASVSILYEEWLRRVPTFGLDPNGSWMFHPALVVSVDSLPLVWG